MEVGDLYIGMVIKFYNNNYFTIVDINNIDKYVNVRFIESGIEYEKKASLDVLIHNINQERWVHDIKFERRIKMRNFYKSCE